MNKYVLHPDESSEFFVYEGCFVVELLNSALDPDVSIARARLEPGGATHLHRLHGITERYLILEGEGMVEVNDRAPEKVGVGDVVMIAAMHNQRIVNTGDKDLIFLAICTPRFEQSAYEDTEPQYRPASASD